MMKAETYKAGEKALTPIQQKKLINSVERFRDEVLLRLALVTGARRSDIVRFEWGNVSETNFSITYLEKKKGDKPLTVFADKNIFTMLKKWREFSYGRFLFPGERGGAHLSSRTAYNILRAVMIQAGLLKKTENWPFHSLRATCIKNAQRAGWTMEETAAHVNDTIITIQKHYTVPSLPERQEVAQKKPLEGEEDGN